MGHDIVDGVKIPFSPERQAEFDAKKAQRLAEKPMKDWEESMRNSDQSLPRWGEDLYDAMNPADQANVSQQTKDLVASKKALRATKP